MASADARHDSLSHLPNMRPRPPQAPQGTARTASAATKSFPGDVLSEWSALAHGEGKGKNQTTARAHAARCVPITRLRAITTPASKPGPRGSAV